MKNRLMPFLAFAALAVFSACTTSSTVMPMTDGTYSITKTGGSFLTTVATLKQDAFKEASEFAAKQGRTVEVVSTNEIPAGAMRFPQVELKFKLAP